MAIFSDDVPAEGTGHRPPAGLPDDQHLSLPEAVVQTGCELKTLSQAVEQSRAAVIVTDIEGRITYVNQAFVQITGFSREDAIGQTPRILKSERTPPDTHARLWATIAAGEPWEGEICNCRRSGEHYWANALISPVKDEKNRISHYIGVQVDITEQKRAEHQLRASEARFRSVVESSLLGLAIEHEGKPVFANRTFAMLFGYSDPQEIFSLASIDSLFPDEERLRLARLRRSAKSGEVSDELMRSEFRCTRRDGSPFWVLTQIQPTSWTSDGAATQMIVIDITLRKLYEERLCRQANYDPLTDLPNRVVAMDRLRNAIAQARRRQRKVAALFVDVDRFKTINDTLGHDAGDRFLVLLTARLTQQVREEDTVARLGGDEFFIILPEIIDRRDAEQVAGKIIKAGALPFEIDGQELCVSVSVGICLYPDDAADAEILLRHADAAMYVAKGRERGTFGFYTPELSAQRHRRARVEAALRRALPGGEFSLVYQPIVDLASGCIVGAEALLRWRSETLGDVATEECILVAEETGLIVPIGEWVLDTVCTEARQWLDAGLPPLRFAVNVSSRQFRGATLARAVRTALDENRLAADTLELEITESLLMEDAVELGQTLDRLERWGVRLTVDDFATGRSSLTCLSRFPLDTLKIGRSFTAGVCVDPAQAALVEAMILMAHRLSLRVVAEGVEEPGQAAFLRTRGCDAAQGFYFSHPLPPDLFRRFVADWRTGSDTANVA
ncbi:MAG: EAL domain-containing protein [Rhodospirillales bacterium]